MSDEPRRLPPWSIDDPDVKLGQECFIVRDANRQALAYVYFEDEPGGDQRRICSPATRRDGQYREIPEYRQGRASGLATTRQISA